MNSGFDLSKYGKLLNGEDSLEVYRIGDEDPNWSRISRYIKLRAPFHVIETVFSESEMDSARVLGFESKSTTGHPQSPRGPWRSFSFDLSAYCRKCGVGAVQNAPIRMKSEVNWGRRQTTQLYGLHDELFVEPKVYQDVFEPLGIGYWPVMSTGGKVLESVVQLRFELFVDMFLPVDHPVVGCSNCQSFKHLYRFQGYWPKVSLEQFLIAKSRQWFGSGADAFHATFVSHEMYQVMKEHKLNCFYMPCA
jgi:hypothetical protein